MLRLIEPKAQLDGRRKIFSNASLIVPLFFEQLSTMMVGIADTFDPDVGDLCLYAPWGNLCIFYRDFRESTSLIPLGHIDSGMDVIGNMTENFTITMEAVK